MKQHAEVHWQRPFPGGGNVYRLTVLGQRSYTFHSETNKRPVVYHHFDRTLLHRVETPRTVNHAAAVAILSLQLLKPLILSYYNTLCWQYIFIFVAQAVNSGYDSLCASLWGCLSECRSEDQADLYSTHKQLGGGFGWNFVQYLLFILVLSVGGVITSSQ